VRRGDIESVEIALPSLQKQREIVVTLEAQLKAAKDQEAAVELALAQASGERKNILKAAFSDQLVPKVPNDEPASKFVRIRAESAGNHKSTPRRRRKTA
jgi:hypothetical protein